MKSVNLFCLPFAGGNKYSYREYEQRAPKFLNIIPLEYPGRGARIREPLLEAMDLLVEDQFNCLKHLIGDTEYGIYGHSMGGVVALFLVKKLIDNGYPDPVHLFITGTTGPSSPSRGSKMRHLMGKKEFIDEILVLDGLPEEVTRHKELVDYFEPILRADFKATETYTYRDSTPLQLPITVITGTEEDMKPEDIQLWQRETDLPIDFITMPGKHFFIFKHPDAIINIIINKLSSYVKI